eukprot:8563757-Ditylum_brightwellii.AAC.1
MSCAPPPPRRTYSSPPHQHPMIHSKEGTAHMESGSSSVMSHYDSPHSLPPILPKHNEEEGKTTDITIMDTANTTTVTIKGIPIKQGKSRKKTPSPKKKSENNNNSAAKEEHDKTPTLEEKRKDDDQTTIVVISNVTTSAA